MKVDAIFVGGLVIVAASLATVLWIVYANPPFLEGYKTGIVAVVTAVMIGALATTVAIAVVAVGIAIGFGMIFTLCVETFFRGK